MNTTQDTTKIDAHVMAGLLRRADDGAEFQFKGWGLLVLDYEDGERQVKVSPDPERPDFASFWLDVDESLEGDLREMAECEDAPVY